MDYSLVTGFHHLGGMVDRLERSLCRSREAVVSGVYVYMILNGRRLMKSKSK
jgi:hypothetical protein